jgi:MoaA/NifB/PqqE/SkfB family radical SAM enzyme
MENKEYNKKFNPFNSWKLLAQCYKWQKIKRGEEIPCPTTISIDPSNICNLNCYFCNSRYERSKNCNTLDCDFMNSLGKQLFGFCETACIGGGGEPTLHPNLNKLIEGLNVNKVKIGMVSNGTMIDKHDLGELTWLGISVNAGRQSTYEKILGKDKFKEVIKNIKELNDKTQGRNLQKYGQGYGVSYKYLLTPNNINELYEAAFIAKDIGCRNIHIRPSSDPWDRKLSMSFCEKDILNFKKQFEKILLLEDEIFGVFGITDKFDKEFNPINDFNKCYAMFMSIVIQPATDKSKGNFNVGFCCDRRGDNDLTLENLNHFDEVKQFWGSEKHWQMQDKIQISKCPRCTFKMHNKIFEEVIQKDNMTYQFI